eukprot:jgi/Astpho2/4722/Aster-00276
MLMSCAINAGTPGTANSISGTPVPTGPNPYGLVVIPKNMGPLQAGDVCSSNWNDANGNAGQGNTINCFRGPQLNNIFKKTIPATGACNVLQNFLPSGQAKGTGVGLTMAFSYIGNGYFLQASLPIPISTVGGTQNTNNTIFKPNPGCLMVLNSTFDIMDTAAGSGVNGVWGSACDVDNDHNDATTTCYFSNVLGPNGNVLGTNNGQVATLQFKPSSRDQDWDSNNWFTNLKVIANGFVSTPSGISGGTVGPSGIASSNNGQKRIYVAGTQDGQQGIIYTIPKGGSGRQTFVPCPASGGCNKPIGLNIIAGHLGGANGGNGFLFANRQDNGQFIETLLVDGSTANGVPGAGNLFNTVQVGNRVLFNDDGTNQVSLLGTFPSAAPPVAAAGVMVNATATASASRRLLMA